MDQNNDKDGNDLSDMLKNSGVTTRPKKYSGSRPRHSSASKMIRWVLKYSGGLIKDEKQARVVLLGFVVVAIIVTLFLFFGIDSNEPTSGTIPPDQLIP